MHKKGFTLMELIIVMSIITVLASFIVGTARLARRRRAIAKTRAAIASVETAITMYQLDMGSYPQDAGGISSLVGALTQNPGDPDWYGPYMNFKTEDLEGGDFIDTWGNPYQYNSSAPQHNTASYDLYSFGEDGPGGDSSDDVTNW